jgi:hypothetical protein
MQLSQVSITVILELRICHHEPMPLDDVTLALLVVVDKAGDSCADVGSSALIVEVEVDLLKPLFSGAR